MNIISVRNLRKSYNHGRTIALRGLDFDVREGEIYGIIGPDGSGKTTLFRILVTLLLADEGTAMVDELDVKKDYREIRRRIGYLPAVCASGIKVPCWWDQASAVSGHLSAVSAYP